jgi:hypothetical protein
MGTICLTLTTMYVDSTEYCNKIGRKWKNVQRGIRACDLQLPDKNVRTKEEKIKNLNSQSHHPHSTLFVVMGLRARRTRRFLVGVSMGGASFDTVGNYTRTNPGTIRAMVCYCDSFDRCYQLHHVVVSYLDLQTDNV